MVRVPVFTASDALLLTAAHTVTGLTAFHVVEGLTADHDASNRTGIHAVSLDDIRDVKN